MGFFNWIKIHYCFIPCYGDFNLSLHDVVTCSSKPNLTGNLAVYSPVTFFCIHFYAYFKVRHPQLEFKVIPGEACFRTDCFKI